jgi:AcrR family transcriptional regulator
MGIAERRENDRRKMRDRILRAAMRLFLKEGFERVTMRGIAEVIEYSPATIYLYFKDKDEILYALNAMGFEKIDENLRELRSIKDPWKRLQRRGEMYLSFATKNPAFYDLMFIMRGPAKGMREKKNVETGIRSYEILKEDVRECLNAGYMHGQDVEVATFALLACLHGVASLIVRDRVVMLPQAQVDSITKASVKFVLNGMLGKRRPGRA